MGQKVNPIGLRLGYIKGWDSNWFGGKDFSDKIVEDDKIRKYIAARLPRGSASKIIIERTLKRIMLTIHTARPGVVIGKGGAEVDKLREELKKLSGKDVQINIFEIKRPEIDARLIGDSIAQQLEARVSYRRAMKQAIASAIRSGAEGIKVKLSGRIGGAEMARTEEYKEGRVPLHTLRADIDYAVAEAQTVYGIIGIKVWVYKGEVYEKMDLHPSSLLEVAQAENKATDRRRGVGNNSGNSDDRDSRGGRGGDKQRRRNNNKGRGGKGNRDKK
jgi:small subunit ribosomal protein S3